VKNRALKRRASRKTRAVRRDLVHAAGCTEPYCSTKYYLHYPDVFDEVRNAPGEETVSVPRSLRAQIGRWL
jgi:hypothetical protein